jgi:hypothetical protein
MRGYATTALEEKIRRQEMLPEVNLLNKRRMFYILGDASLPPCVPCE